MSTDLQIDPYIRKRKFLPPVYPNLEQVSLEDLLSLTLKEGTVKNLLAQYPSLPALYEASMEELCLVKGLGPAKAYQIKGSLELGRRMFTIPLDEKPQVKSPADVANFLTPKLTLLDREHFMVLHLNMKNRILAVETISIGSLNSSIVHPREVFRGAIRRSTAAIILAHNHPSGDPTPSKEDQDVTKRLFEAGKTLGIDVLDHIIIGQVGKFISFKEQGLL